MTTNTSGFTGEYLNFHFDCVLTLTRSIVYANKNVTDDVIYEKRIKIFILKYRSGVCCVASGI